VRTIVAVASAALCMGASLVAAVPTPALDGGGEAERVRFDATADMGSLYNVGRIIGVSSLWMQGYTGRGVDVALIDTGVSPVKGLDGGQIVNGPDFSFDRAVPELAHLDGYGHGTHLAGIIAGRDGRSRHASAYIDADRFVGVAPDARIVNVKVGASNGAVDVSQVIAALEWTVEHRQADGLNIGVINLSFGTDAVQPALVDPLAYAVDQAWRAGIVVVVAAGNDGMAAPQVANPATNPVIIAVGADDPMGTLTLSDDEVPDFASHGNFLRSVDVIAPATHLLSLRVPGSYIDRQHPAAVVAERFFRGSGTSQGAAVVAGLVALLRQKYPTATPDQIKGYLMSTARSIGPGLIGLPLLGDPVNSYYAGKGVVTAAPTAWMRSLPPSAQLTVPATGLGSLQLARGTAYVTSALQPLTGEVDIFGEDWVLGWLSDRWSADRWSEEDWTGNRWSDGTWSGNRWSGDGWSGGDWAGNRWSGDEWTGNRWSTGAWG
jgi:serine protease AprX